MNLTSVKPGPEMVTRHYCESLFLGVHLPGANDSSMLQTSDPGRDFPEFLLPMLRPRLADYSGGVRPTESRVSAGSHPASEKCERARPDALKTSRVGLIGSFREPFIPRMFWHKYRGWPLASGC